MLVVSPAIDDRRVARKERGNEADGQSSVSRRLALMDSRMVEMDAGMETRPSKSMLCWRKASEGDQWRAVAVDSSSRAE